MESSCEPESPVTGGWRVRAGCVSQPESDHPCKRRSCPECGLKWGRDAARKLQENLGYFGGEIRSTALTAPGTPDHYLSQPAHRRPSKRWIVRYAIPPHDVRAAVTWNMHAERRYARLHKSAMEHVRRVLRRQGYDGPIPIKLVHVWELQKRGLLHVHITLPHSTPAERVMAQEYISYLARHGQRYGFGWTDRKRKVYEAHKTAGYLSKYLTKGEFARVAAHIGNLVHVSRRLTMATGVTMRVLRSARWLWVCIRYGIPLPRQWSIEYIALLDRVCPIAEIPRGP